MVPVAHYTLNKKVNGDEMQTKYEAYDYVEKCNTEMMKTAAPQICLLYKAL